MQQTTRLLPLGVGWTRALAVSLAMLFATDQALAVIRTNVNTVPGFKDKLTTVAIVPIEPCPVGIDCLYIEDLLRQRLWKHAKKNPMTAKAVRQRLFELEVDLVSFETPTALAEALGVDYLLIATIGGAEEVNAGAWGAALLGGAAGALHQKVDASSEVVLVEAASGKQLFRGVATGTSYRRDKKAVLKQLNEMLEEAFSRP